VHKKLCSKILELPVDKHKHVSSEVRDGVMVIKIDSPGSKVLQ